MIFHTRLLQFPFFQLSEYNKLEVFLLKDDCIRSSLIECQSFLNSKIDVDPIYCVLMSLPCIMQVYA